jgi:hypothetical protein
MPTLAGLWAALRAEGLVRTGTPTTVRTDPGR